MASTHQHVIETDLGPVRVDYTLRPGTRTTPRTMGYAGAPGEDPSIDVIEASHYRTEPTYDQFHRKTGTRIVQRDLPSCLFEYIEANFSDELIGAAENDFTGILQAAE